MANATIDARTSNYEAMILIGQGAAAQLPEILTLIRQNIERQGGRIIAMKKWDERRLAYEIDKQKRALYILCYFNVPNTSLGHIERGFNLAEQIMRVLITKVEHLSEDEMRAADAMKDLEAEAKLRATQPNLVPANITAPPTIDPNIEDED